MECNKKTNTNPGAGEDCTTAGPSRLNSPETSLHRESAAQSAPHGTALKALDINSADEVRQAVKSVLNESKVTSKNSEDGTANAQNEDKVQCTEDTLTQEQKSENKTLFDIVKMTMQLVEESEHKPRGGKKNEQQKPNENKKKRRHSRRIKAVPRKRGRYSKVYNGRLSNVAGLKNKKKKPQGTVLSSDSDSDLLSISTPSTKSESSL